ncbi:hypothetical protein TNCT_181281 [Trichonephila clavata]|uniref:Uncharacterized protein n=1 Tax=Trichonephila clavata TaxID=2740835 RepID=A0A8X6I2F9_TRICU|nr:hypothetical protein TNCT_181281 [Trichonephila clavata]
MWRSGNFGRKSRDRSVPRFLFLRSSTRFFLLRLLHCHIARGTGSLCHVETFYAMGWKECKIGVVQPSQAAFRFEWNGGKKHSCFLALT